MNFELKELYTKIIKLLNENKHDEVIALLPDSIIENYNESFLYFQRAKSFSKLENYDRAIDDYTKAIKLNPDYADAFGNRSYLLELKGEYERAIEDISKYIELNPTSEIGYNNRGNLYSKIGDYDKAISDYSKSIEINANNAIFYFNRGKQWFKKANYIKSIDDYTTALQLKSDFGVALYMRGISWYNLQEYHKSNDDLIGYLRQVDSLDNDLAKTAETYISELAKLLKGKTINEEVKSRTIEKRNYAPIVIISFEDYIKYFLKVTDLGNVGTIHLEFNADGTLKSEDAEDGSGKVYYLTDANTSPRHYLYRGQSGEFDLIPKLARTNRGNNLIQSEINLISELRRRRDISNPVLNMTDWEIIVYAQHFGLATRLLDWSTNPLIALWFACSDEASNEDAFVYFLEQETKDILDLSIEKSPFQIQKTQVFKPSINNPRISAQNGWFTIHKIDEETGAMISLNEDLNFSNKIQVIRIPKQYKPIMLDKLNILGINSETIFPGLEGTCKYLNWQYT